MDETILIDNGPAIQLQGRPAQGTRHDVLFGVVTDTGQSVVVKLERIPGALSRERTALACVGAQHGLAPRLLRFGTTVTQGKRVRCLVTERCPGSPPTTTEGWRRMGRAHARLGDLRHLPDGLRVLDTVTFGRQHAERVSDLGDRLASLARTIPDWTQLVSPEVPASPPLTVTHGDPGPGNYLDDGEQGTLIDWEEAHIAPRGLDLARLVFIALLGAGPSGYRGRDHRSRAEAAVNGYLGSSRDRWHPSREESRWWATVAGIQFIHRRWALGDRPAPWKDALEVLHHVALTDDIMAV